MITMPPKVSKKGSKVKKTKRPKAKKTVQVKQMTDSDASELLLDPVGSSQQAVSEHEDMEEGEEASERPEATQATLEDPEDENEGSGAPPRKRATISDELTMAHEQDLVEFLAEHPSSTTRHSRTLRTIQRRTTCWMTRERSWA